MEKKFLMFMFPLLTASCTILQQKTDTETGGSTSSTNRSGKSRDDSVTRKENEKRTPKKHTENKNSSGNLDKSISSFEGNFSNSSFIISKISELKSRNSKILQSGSPQEIRMVKLQAALLESFKNWKDTKYLFGGDSHSGIDCSALTRRIYREVFKYELPRVSTEQIKTGRHVSIQNLKPGDILFFRPENRTNHTAVYIGNSLFINASSSKGVILSSLENSYWKSYFKHGVRIETNT